VAILTDEIQLKVVTCLGYAYDSVHLFTSLKADIPNMVVYRVSEILDDIESIRADTKNSSTSAHAIKVDDIEVDFGRSIVALKALQTSLINELSALIGIPLAGGNNSRSSVKVQYQ
jgi:hypothetical protein